MVRTLSAGVFAGILISRTENVVLLKQARRIWYWDGAATLSQLAQSWTSCPSKCKFPEPVGQVVLMGVIEIIPITAKAARSIKAVPIWKN